MPNQTEHIKLSDLKKLPNNPRTIKDDQFRTLVESIQANPDYFEARPVICSNRTGELIILAGNQRYEAAKFLKLKEVPVYVMEGLTEEREKEIIIRDNISNGSWDWDELANSWNTEELTEWGLDIPGFSGGDGVKDPFNDPGIAAQNKFGIIVECDSAGAQESIFNDLQGMGYKCKILVV